MCGIAGYIGIKRIEDDRVERCLRTMRHRGPDDSGVYHHAHPSGHHCLLLHTRLAILDLDERAAQPMRNGSHVLTYNGELYNFIELRDKLAARGTTFRTYSDTEVLLLALKTQGPEALDECEGMWAFALYDEKQGSLRLCRDRFGEKPLYLLETSHGLFFGSEIKFIAELSGQHLQPNLQQIRRYLVNGYKSLYKQSDTFFCNIHELEPAHFLTFSPGSPLERKRFWAPNFDSRVQDMSFQDAVYGVRTRLIRSMELRLRSDVPLAFCMSGGVDSNALVAIARRTLGYDVHGFTIVNTDARYDEWDLVQQACAELSIQHTAIPICTDGFMEGMRSLVRQHDAPVLTISYYAHYLLTQAVAEHGYKVSISGTAADELFTGYYDHHSMYLAALHDTPEFDLAMRAWQEHIRPIVRNPLLQDPLAFVKDSRQREHIYLDSDRFASYLTTPFQEVFTEQNYCQELLRNRMLNELFHEAVPAILHEDDLNAMAVSLENRSPFLDRKLFEFTLTIPTKHLIRNGYNKAVLREAIRGIAPDAIVDNRRKIGFNAPIFDFLDINDDRVNTELLSDSPIFEIVRKEALQALLKRDRLPNSDSKFLFYLLSAKFFLEEAA